jgi:hypothetical protein
MPNGFRCDGLAAAEAEKVGRLSGDIRERLAPAAVAFCYAVGRNGRRVLCFTQSDGRLAGCVAADAFLASDDEGAAARLTPWPG